MKILYEDNHLLVVEKPVNVPVQADASKDLDLLNMGKEYIKKKYQKAGNVYLGLVHRLDRPVGGVLVFAKTSKAAKRLSEDMQKGNWSKTYSAIAEGNPPKHADLHDYLYKDEKTRTTHVTQDETKGKRANLTFDKISEINDLSLVRIELDTGRHHQIRVQLSSRGWPIWGDARYNATSKAGQQIALWATELTILHPTKREKMTFQSNPSGIPWNTFFEKNEL